MFLFGKKKRLLIDFANQVAEELYRRVPPKIVDEHLSGKSKSATRKFNDGLDEGIMRIAQFKANEHLGIYGKAKLHQVFANRLLELGYSNELANEINQYILIKTP
ncbi:MAG: hypothetical protein AB2806_21980 [Candidatus Thiodiazotropha sp.]